MKNDDVSQAEAPAGAVPPSPEKLSAQPAIDQTPPAFERDPVAEEGRRLEQQDLWKTVGSKWQENQERGDAAASAQIDPVQVEVRLNLNPAHERLTREQKQHLVEEFNTKAARQAALDPGHMSLEEFKDDAKQGFIRTRRGSVTRYFEQKERQGSDAESASAGPSAKKQYDRGL